MQKKGVYIASKIPKIVPKMMWDEERNKIVGLDIRKIEEKKREKDNTAS